jgi:uncharacterized protein involved in response to NO
MKTTAQILRAYRGPALFSFGFRPFFLLAALWAALAVPLWMLALLGWDGAMAGSFTRDWHVHEMLFGYTGAVIVGYMIVAGANWTGHYPVAGWPVALLALLWLAGRAAMLASASLGLGAAVIDAAFLILFALILWREQLAANNWRSLAPCIVVSLLAIANVGFHARAVVPEIGVTSERLALGLITFLIVLMGGRLVPSFTRNWMAQHKVKPEPAPPDRLDRASVAVTGVAILLWVLLPAALVTGVVLLVAGAGVLVRLLRWRGWAAAREGMVLILHLGYFWCALGLALLGASILSPGHVPGTAAVHALTAGAIGVMTLAMMTRTSRSHTGRERRADAATLAIYALANAAAAVRVAAPFALAVHMELLGLSTVCWSLAFGLFVLAYGPMLLRPWHRPG